MHRLFTKLDLDRLASEGRVDVDTTKGTLLDSTEGPGTGSRSGDPGTIKRRQFPHWGSP